VTNVYFVVSLFLLLTLLGGLQRILKAPSRADRMLAAQLFGTTGIAILLIVGEAMGTPGVDDVALLFALLAVINVTTFVYSGGGERDE
jgi:multicomponent Na+:H+ antiporter subunit F